MEPKKTPVPEQPNTQDIDYSKPVAYDQQGNPLYARPPVEQSSPQSRREAKVPTKEELGSERKNAVHPWMADEAHAEKSLHFLEAEKRLSSEGRTVFKMIEFDDEEDLVTEVRKHWFGLVLLWLVGMAATLIVAVVPMILAGQADFFNTAGVSTDGFSAALVAIGLLLGGLTFLATFLVGIMYTKNVIFVTTDKIAQVKYTGLIHRKISQLGIGDVQDVTVNQNTIPSRIFNYGTLVIETAGEQNNYTFTYVPKPYQESKAIIWAREENVKRYGN